MLRRSVLLASLALTSTATAQVAETWSLTIDQSSLGDRPRAALVDPSGASTLVGSDVTFTDQFGATVYTDASISRVSADGTLLWHGTLSVSATERTEFHDVARGPDGSFYAGGYTVEPNVDAVLVLARYAADGTELWSILYDTDAYETATSIATDPSGDVWTVGTRQTPAGATDVLVLRVTPAGTIAAVRTWNGTFSGTDIGTAIAPDGQGGAYVTGQVLAAGGSAILLLRLDAQANVVWAREFASTTTSDQAEGLDLAVDTNGNAYVAGRLGPPGSASRAMLMKYDADGNQLWVRLLSSPIHDRGAAYRVAIDPRGDLVIAGWWGWLSSPTQSDVVVGKLDPAGNYVWARSWTGLGGRDTALDLAIDEGGEIAVAGASIPLGQVYPYDALALRYDRDGRELWSRTFGAPDKNDWGFGIGFGPTGGVVLAATIATSEQDALVVRFDDSSVPFCFADGSGTACPCGNASPASERAGCTSSIGTGGRLTADGSASLANDTLTLRGSDMPSIASALYFQGTAQVGAGAGSVFGDGLRCAGGTNVRLKTVANSAGASQFPAAGDPSVSVRGQIAAPGLRIYQVWYRNAAAFCTAATFNLTNGVAVTWTN